MPAFTQIVGALIVCGALLMGAHEIWLYRHPQAQGLRVTRRRLRRRLAGVALLLLLVALLTWAGSLGGGDRAQAILRLGLYGVALLAAIGLLGLAYADSRETGQQVLRETLASGDPELDELLAHKAEALMEELQRRDLSREEMERLSQQLETILQRRGSDRPE